MKKQGKQTRSKNVSHKSSSALNSYVTTSPSSSTPMQSENSTSNSSKQTTDDSLHKKISREFSSDQSTDRPHMLESRNTGMKHTTNVSNNKSDKASTTNRKLAKHIDKHPDHFSTNQNAKTAGSRSSIQMSSLIGIGRLSSGDGRFGSGQLRGNLTRGQSKYGTSKHSKYGKDQQGFGSGCFEIIGSEKGEFEMAEFEKGESANNKNATQTTKSSNKGFVPPGGPASIPSTITYQPAERDVWKQKVWEGEKDTSSSGRTSGYHGSYIHTGSSKEAFVKRREIGSDNSHSNCSSNSNMHSSMDSCRPHSPLFKKPLVIKPARGRNYCKNFCCDPCCNGACLSLSCNPRACNSEKFSYDIKNFMCCSSDPNNIVCCDNDHNNPVCCNNDLNDSVRCSNELNDSVCCSNDLNDSVCCSNDFTNPVCCSNDFINSVCCSNDFINPVCCSNDLNESVCCSNDLNDSVCCSNDFTNPVCCNNDFINSVCCSNDLNDSVCCSNDFTNPVCCNNGFINSVCCSNDFTNPVCCSNDFINPVCCSNEFKNSVCCSNDLNKPVCCRCSPNNFESCENDLNIPVCCSSDFKRPVSCSKDLKSTVSCSNNLNNPVTCSNNLNNPVTCSNDLNNPVSSSNFVACVDDCCYNLSIKDETCKKTIFNKNLYSKLSTSNKCCSSNHSYLFDSNQPHNVISAPKSTRQLYPPPLATSIPLASAFITASPHNSSNPSPTQVCYPLPPPTPSLPIFSPSPSSSSLFFPSLRLSPLSPSYLPLSTPSSPPSPSFPSPSPSFLLSSIPSSSNACFFIRRLQPPPSPFQPNFVLVIPKQFFLKKKDS